MEHFKSPFGSGDFVSARTLENQKFFEGLLERTNSHPFFSHAFMSAFDKVAPSPDVATFILTSFYKIVSPFTGLLCALAGRAPDLRIRFALMDNLYEEMGCGDIQSAHPQLYLQMLASIGVSSGTAEGMPTLPAIRRINDHLSKVVSLGDFSVACAVLASAESTIPPSFPILAALARGAFPHADMTFFDRHGTRDVGHADDASLLFALSGRRCHFPAVEAAVNLDLDHRCALFDAWMLTMTKPTASGQFSVTERPQRPTRMRSPAATTSRPPAAGHDSAAPRT